MKPDPVVNVIGHHIVTPFVGVWIETILIFIKLQLQRVTPFVGVWIETYLKHLLIKPS